MRYRRADGGFGSGYEDEHPDAWGHRSRGGHYPTGEHLSEWQARRHDGYRGYGASAEQWHGGQNHGPPYPDPELHAPHHQQHGYGLSQYGYADEGRAEDRGPHYGKGPKGYRRSDDRIREEVCEVMSRQGFIDASDVEVSVEGAVVRLTGTVGSRQDKRALEQMADRVHGVEEVENEIRLRRPGRAEAPSGADAARGGPTSQNGTGRSAQS